MFPAPLSCICVVALNCLEDYARGCRCEELGLPGLELLGDDALEDFALTGGRRSLLACALADILNRGSLTSAAP